MQVQARLSMLPGLSRYAVGLTQHQLLDKIFWEIERRGDIKFRSVDRHRSARHLLISRLQIGFLQLTFTAQMDSGITTARSTLHLVSFPFISMVLKNHLPVTAQLREAHQANILLSVLSITMAL